MASLPGFNGKFSPDSLASLPGIGGKFGPDYAPLMSSSLITITIDSMLSELIVFD